MQSLGIFQASASRRRRAAPCNTRARRRLGFAGHAERGERGFLHKPRQPEQHAQHERCTRHARSASAGPPSSPRASRSSHGSWTGCRWSPPGRAGGWRGPELLLLRCKPRIHLIPATTHSANSLGRDRRSAPCRAVEAITPLGLLGVAENNARVRGVIASVNASRSIRKSSPAGTRTRRAPEHRDRRRIGRIHRLAGNHLIARTCGGTRRGGKQRVLRAG